MAYITAHLLIFLCGIFSFIGIFFFYQKFKKEEHRRGLNLALACTCCILLALSWISYNSGFETKTEYAHFNSEGELVEISESLKGKLPTTKKKEVRQPDTEKEEGVEILTPQTGGVTIKNIQDLLIVVTLALIVIAIVVGAVVLMRRNTTKTSTERKSVNMKYALVAVGGVVLVLAVLFLCATPEFHLSFGINSNKGTSDEAGSSKKQLETNSVAKATEAPKEEKKEDEYIIIAGPPDTHPTQTHSQVIPFSGAAVQVNIDNRVVNTQEEQWLGGAPAASIAERIRLLNLTPLEPTKPSITQCVTNNVENWFGLATGPIRITCVTLTSGGSSFTNPSDLQLHLRLLLRDFLSKYERELADNNDYDNPLDPNDQGKLLMRFNEFLGRTKDSGYTTRNWAQWIQTHNLAIGISFYNK